MITKKSPDGDYSDLTLNKELGAGNNNWLIKSHNNKAIFYFLKVFVNP